MNRTPNPVLPAPGRTTNVRMVLVDEDRLPTYLQRAAELEARMLKAAADAGVEAADMPGLRGLCVEAIKAAERHGR